MNPAGEVREAAARKTARSRLFRSGLLVFAFVPVVLLAMRLFFHGPVPWFYDWPFVAAMLVVSLAANHLLWRLDLPAGATRPHWADSAMLHEAMQKLDRDLAKPEVPLATPMSDEEMNATLEAFSRRTDQSAAIAETEALLRQQFELRAAGVFKEDRVGRRGLRERSRVANLVIVLLLGLGMGWMLYVAYF